MEQMVTLLKVSCLCLLPQECDHKYMIEKKQDPNMQSVEEMMKKYDVKNLKDGFNTVNGEEIFYISNPALGLWALKKSFY